jgi:hypothetical protein
MNPKNLYNIMTLNLEPLSRWSAREMITYLYGDTVCKQVLNKVNHSTGTADPKQSVEAVLQRDLLPRVSVERILGPLTTDKMHDKYIIPASAITQQCINEEERTITIPIQAFEGKSLIALEVGSSTQPFIYYYILLQSGKDPNTLQPVRMMIGARTKELKMNLSSYHLRENQGWEIQVSHPGTLQKALQYYNEPQGTSHTEPWAIRTGKKGLSIPIHPTDRSARDYISTAMDPTATTAAMQRMIQYIKSSGLDNNGLDPLYYQP